MTRVGFVHIYRWCRWGSVKTPPHAVITVEDVPWVVLLQSDSLLLVFGPGQQVHSLPSILDQYRMRAITISPMIAMQDDRIVGQWVPPILGLRRPGITVPGSQSSVRSWWFLILLLRNPRMLLPSLSLARMENRMDGYSYCCLWDVK